MNQEVEPREPQPTELAEATPYVEAGYEVAESETCACCSGTCGTSDSCQ